MKIKAVLYVLPHYFSHYGSTPLYVWHTSTLLFYLFPLLAFIVLSCVLALSRIEVIFAKDPNVQYRKSIPTIFGRPRPLASSTCLSHLLVSFGFYSFQPSAQMREDESHGLPLSMWTMATFHLFNAFVFWRSCNQVGSLLLTSERWTSTKWWG